LAHWVPLPAPGPPRTKMTVVVVGEKVGVGLGGAGRRPPLSFWGRVGMSVGSIGVSGWEVETGRLDGMGGREKRGSV